MVWQTDALGSKPPARQPHGRLSAGGKVVKAGGLVEGGCTVFPWTCVYLHVEVCRHGEGRQNNWGRSVKSEFAMLLK